MKHLQKTCLAVFVLLIVISACDGGSSHKSSMPDYGESLKTTGR